MTSVIGAAHHTRRVASPLRNGVVGANVERTGGLSRRKLRPDKRGEGDQQGADREGSDLGAHCASVVAT